MMGLYQFFSFFGSKSSLSKNYPVPKYDKIIEPFCGSAGYSCLYYDKEIILSDLDPTIVNIWNFLINSTKNDILSLPLSLEDIKKLSIVEQDFIGFWFSRCSSRPSRIITPWGLSNKYPSSFWSIRTRERIANQVEKINHWKCNLMNYNDYKDSNTPCTWFIDPPYQKQGHHYKFNSKNINYVELGKWVESLPGQKITCESKGADWLDFKYLYTNKTINPKKSVGVDEMVSILE